VRRLPFEQPPRAQDELGIADVPEAGTIAKNSAWRGDSQIFKSAKESNRTESAERRLAEIIESRKQGYGGRLPR
jgi:hypothetical protein